MCCLLTPAVASPYEERAVMPIAGLGTGQLWRRCGVMRRRSKLFEEREECVWGVVAVWGGVWGCGSGEGFLFEGHVGVQVDAGGGRAFVTEPERDDGDVDAGEEEFHRGGVS